MSLESHSPVEQHNLETLKEEAEGLTQEHNNPCIKFLILLLNEFGRFSLKQN